MFTPSGQSNALSFPPLDLPRSDHAFGGHFYTVKLYFDYSEFHFSTTLRSRFDFAADRKLGIRRSLAKVRGTDCWKSEFSKRGLPWSREAHVYARSPPTDIPKFIPRRTRSRGNSIVSSHREPREEPRFGMVRQSLETAWYRADRLPVDT